MVRAGKIEIGNCKTASFWYDVWTPFGKLIDFIGPRGPRDLGIRINSTVGDPCNEQRWLIRQPRSDQSLELLSHLTSVSLPSLSVDGDQYCWLVDDKLQDRFVLGRTWDALRHRSDELTWSNLIWFKGATPKHAFHMWLTQLDRLPTRARLAGWGLQTSPNCCLCDAEIETRDHLLLLCNYSRIIWSSVLRHLRDRQTYFTSWNHLQDWRNDATSYSPKTIRLVVTQATLYSIWRQRNNLLHNSETIPPELIFKGIDRLIRNTITIRKHRKGFKNLMWFWLY